MMINAYTNDILQIETFQFCATLFRSYWKWDGPDACSIAAGGGLFNVHPKDQSGDSGVDAVEGVEGRIEDSLPIHFLIILKKSKHLRTWRAWFSAIGVAEHCRSFGDLTVSFEAGLRARRSPSGMW